MEIVQPMMWNEISKFEQYTPVEPSLTYGSGVQSEHYKLIEMKTHYSLSRLRSAWTEILSLKTLTNFLTFERIL